MMKSICRFYNHFFAGVNLYITMGMVVGLSLIYGDMRLSGAFGASISEPVMWIAMGLSLASGILLVLAAVNWVSGFKPMAICLSVVWVFAFSFNVYSNMGVTTSDRVNNIKQAAFKDDNRSMLMKSKAAAEARVKMLTNHIDQLRSQRGWLAVQPSSVLAAKIKAYPGIQSHIWSRTDKCNDASIPASIAYCKGYVSLNQDYAIAKEIEAKERMIEASHKTIAKDRIKLSEMPLGHSEAKEQSKLHALIADFRLSGTTSNEGLQAANNFTGIFLAIALAVVAAGVTLAGAWPMIVQAGPYQSPEVRSLPVTASTDPQNSDPSRSTIFTKNLPNRVKGIMLDFDSITGRRTQRQIELVA